MLVELQEWVKNGARSVRVRWTLGAWEVTLTDRPQDGSAPLHSAAMAPDLEQACDEALTEFRYNWGHD